MLFDLLAVSLVKRKISWKIIMVVTAGLAVTWLGNQMRAQNFVTRTVCLMVGKSIKIHHKSVAFLPVFNGTVLT